MKVEAKILDPICIKLGKNSNIILGDEVNKEEQALTPGVLFGGEHYGFVLIIDYNGQQKEIVYPTQCSIQAAGIEAEDLQIFEEGKRTSWRFDKKGNLKNNPQDDFTDEFKSNYASIIENHRMFIGTPISLNPVRIKISRKPEESCILKSDEASIDYPLYPGAMLGDVHYGFILIIETDQESKEVVYPTQNRVEAVGIEGDVLGDLKVFESGKYHPWVFTYKGKFKEISSYNPNSRKDIQYVEDCIKASADPKKLCFRPQSKK